MQTIKSIKAAAKNGQTVEYRISEHLKKISVEVFVDGKRKAGGFPEVVNSTIQGHYIHGKVASVYITKGDVWSDIVSAYAEAKAALEESDEYKMTQLLEQRETLAYNLKYAQEELYEAETRKVEMAGQGHPYRYDAEAMEIEIATAKAALAAFDKAHPEVIALINKDRDERTERNMWN